MRNNSVLKSFISFLWRFAKYFPFWPIFLSPDTSCRICLWRVHQTATSCSVGTLAFGEIERNTAYIVISKKCVLQQCCSLCPLSCRLAGVSSGEYLSAHLKNWRKSDGHADSIDISCIVPLWFHRVKNCECWFILDFTNTVPSLELEENLYQASMEVVDMQFCDGQQSRTQSMSGLRLPLLKRHVNFHVCITLF